MIVDNIRPTLVRTMLVASFAVIGAAFALAAAAQWTPSAQAPAGTLTHALEAQRHDRFIEIARNGDIDLVFFGTTSTEMWSWKDRGRSVWDRQFGSLKAASFGSQLSPAPSAVMRPRLSSWQSSRCNLACTWRFSISSPYRRSMAPSSCWLPASRFPYTTNSPVSGSFFFWLLCLPLIWADR